MCSALANVRGQSLTQDALVRFTNYFGQAGERAPSTNTAYAKANMRPEIVLISNVRENGETIGALPDGELHFHHDMIQTDVPHMASCLYAIEVPNYGGETCFAAGYAAYDTLPAELKNQLEGKRVHHYYRYGTTKRGDEKGATVRRSIAASRLPHARRSTDYQRLHSPGKAELLHQAAPFLALGG